LKEDEMNRADRAVFFDAIRPLQLSGQLMPEQVLRIEAVLDGALERDLLDTQIAYILATGHFETDNWRTLEEYASGRAYEGRRDLGNVHKGDGPRFKGRGIVMITGRRNYADWSQRLGIDFISQPDLVKELKYAVPILIDGMMLGTFTGLPLVKYINEDGADFYTARKTVNGLNRAATIATLAQRYLTALRNAEAAPAPTPAPAPEKPKGSVLHLQDVKIVINEDGAMITWSSIR
jgi:hypothetical protein